MSISNIRLGRRETEATHTFTLDNIARSLLARWQSEVVIEHYESEYHFDFNRGEESSGARMLSVPKVQSSLVGRDPLMLLAGKASLLSKTIVSVTIKVVRVLVVGWVVRDRFYWTADKCSFWDDCAIRETEVIEKDTLSKGWDESA